MLNFENIFVVKAYDGRSPVVYISDPAIIRLITTVDFDHFPNRNYFLGGMFEHLLDALKGEFWKFICAVVVDNHNFV